MSLGCSDEDPSTVGPSTEVVLDGGAAQDAPSPPARVATFAVQPRRGASEVPIGTVTVDLGSAAAPDSPVTVSLASGPGTLKGTTAVAATGSTATFGDLAISKAGAYRLVATVAGLDVATSEEIVVDAWQSFSGGISAGMVWSLAVDPTNGDVAFAGTRGGVYRTVDGGSSWSLVGLPGRFAYALAVAPSNPLRVYAAAEDALYRSDDRGASWKPANTGYVAGAITGLAVHPTDPARVIWAAGDNGLLASADGGVSWTPTNDPAFAGQRVVAVARAPSNPDRLYVQAYAQQVYTSANGGASWTEMAGLPANSGVRSFAVHPTDPQTVYAGLGESASGAWKSVAGGAFTKLEPATPAVADAFVSGVAIVPSDPDVLYASASGFDVLKSTNGGQSWTALGVGNSDATPSLAVAPSAPSVVYLGRAQGLSRGGVMKSVNAGESWVIASTGIEAFDVHGIAVDSSAKIWLSGGHVSVQVSTNSGATYKAFDASHGLVHDGDIPLALAPDGTTVYAGTSGGLYTSTDGVSFVKNTALATPVRRLAPSPVSAATIYAAGANGGLATSNGGATWSFQTVSGTHSGGIAAHPTIASTAYEGLADGLYRTTDSGQGWSKVTMPAPVYDPEVAFGKTGQVYVADRAVVTSNDGATWTTIAPGGLPLDADHRATSLTTLTIEGSEEIFLGVEANGLWRRAGGTWIKSGLDRHRVLVVAQDPTHPKILYAGVAAGGMYRSLSGGR